MISGHDAWVTSYKDIRGVDLSAHGGVKSSTLHDFAVQQHDLQTGRLLYTWDAYRHVALSDSYQAPPAKATVPGDAYHGNSADLVGNGQFFVPMRNTRAALLVEARTGRIVWTLGGKDSGISVPSNAHFERQHDVTLSNGDLLTVCDDNCCEILGDGTFGSPGGPAKGPVLQLDQKKHTVALVHRYLHAVPGRSTWTAHTSTWPSPAACNCSPAATFWSAVDPSRTSPSTRRPARCCSTRSSWERTSAAAPFTPTTGGQARLSACSGPPKPSWSRRRASYWSRERQTAPQLLDRGGREDVATLPTARAATHRAPAGADTSIVVPNPARVAIPSAQPAAAAPAKGEELPPRASQATHHVNSCDATVFNACRGRPQGETCPSEPEHAIDQPNGGRAPRSRRVALAAGTRAWLAAGLGVTRPIGAP